MTYSENLAGRIRAALKRTGGVGERKMFGGVCFTLNGNMVCGVVKDELMVRVGPAAYSKSVKQPHARPMDFTGRPMVGFVYVGTGGIRSDPTLKRWVDAGIAYARTLAPKSKRTSPAKGRITKKGSVPKTSQKARAAQARRSSKAGPGRKPTIA